MPESHSFGLIAAEDIFELH